MAVKWTEEKYREAVAWKKANDKSSAETEKHFGMSLNYLSHLRANYDGKKVRPDKRQKPTDFVDIISQPTQTRELVTIIRCQPSQLAEVLGGLK